MSTTLDQLYSLRQNFSIIGLTGRTGSGCTEISEILSRSFDDLEDLRKPEDIKETVFQRKYKIVYDYCKHPNNWKNYKVIEYKRVLMLILLPELLKDENKNETLLFDFYRDKLKTEPDKKAINLLIIQIRGIMKSNKELLERIKSLGDISKIKTRKNLRELNDIFWNNDSFKIMSDSIDKILIDKSLTSRIMLLHHIANNFRKSRQPFKTKISDPQNIYFIAEVINRIIKSANVDNDSCHIVIDSLRNSLEVNFFKERFSAFCLVAVKNDKRKSRLLEKKTGCAESVIDRILEMDEMEYDSSDFQNGEFFSPDVQNCIQRADYHLNNHSEKIDDLDEELRKKHQFTFYSFSEQLIKLQALIQQPGIITPSPEERVMQIAYTAKLNSGCISRQVGAVVTNEGFSIKAVGWNDVPKGAVPCSVRNVKELSNSETAFGFTKFEIGKGLKETEQIHDGDEKSEIDKESNDFHVFVKDNYNDAKLPEEKLGGRSCPYCFKQAYNAFSGEKNQVHTRSLHAEENAMLQISKDGGQKLKNGNLFTTASPCELCAKKAYQIGINTIYYIDPYPGISRNHILKSNEKTDPKMILFSGAVGRAYHKLYEPFLSQKDEIAMLTNHKIESPSKIKAIQLRNLLGKNFKGKDELKQKLDEILEDDDQIFEKVLGLIEKGLKEG